MSSCIPPTRKCRGYLSNKHLNTEGLLTIKTNLQRFHRRPGRGTSRQKPAFSPLSATHGKQSKNTSSCHDNSFNSEPSKSTSFVTSACRKYVLWELSLHSIDWSIT